MNSSNGGYRAPLRFHNAWMALGIGWALIIVYLSLMPDPPRLEESGGFKFDHAGAYFCLMTWFSQIYFSWRARWKWAAACCILGIVLEYLQGLTEYRTFAYTDMLINASGIAFALLIALTPLQYVLRRIESFLPDTSRQQP